MGIPQIAEEGPDFQISAVCGSRINPRNGLMDFRQASALIIPAFNAERYLAHTLKGLEQKIPAEKILVVDDGSTDQTEKVALEAGVHCIKHIDNQGKGSALMTGFLWAQSQGFSWVITMDADGQHNPSDLEAFWRTEIGDRTGILVGRRSILGSSMPVHRRFSNYLTTRMISGLAKSPVYDAQSGFRMYRISILQSLRLPRYGRFEWEAQALVLFCRQGFKVIPVDIATVYTDNGSHMHLVRDTLRFLKMYWRMAWTL